MFVGGAVAPALQPPGFAPAHPADNFDHPDAFDQDALLACLTDLKRGRAVDVPIYDFNRHQRSSEVRKVCGVGSRPAPSGPLTRREACAPDRVCARARHFTHSSMRPHTRRVQGPGTSHTQ